MWSEKRFSLFMLLGFGAVCFAVGLLSTRAFQPPLAEASVKPPPDAAQRLQASSPSPGKEAPVSVSPPHPQSSFTDSPGSVARAVNESIETATAPLPTKLYSNRIELSDEQKQELEQLINSHLPSPYAEMMSDPGGYVWQQDFLRFAKEDYDYHWGDSMRQQILDFIALNDESGALQVRSLVCKTTTCELRATLPEQAAWSVQSVWGAMRRESWYEFNNVGGGVTIDDGERLYYYQILKKD